MEAYFQVIVLCMFVIKLPTKYVSFSKFSRETCADAQVIVQFWRGSSHSLQAALVPKMGSVAWRTNRQPKVENTSLANSEEEVKSFKISFACIKQKAAMAMGWKRTECSASKTTEN